MAVTDHPLTDPKENYYMTNFQTHVDRANAAAVEAASLTADDLERMREELPELETAAMQAELVPDDVRADWRRGVDRPVTDLLEAQAGAEKAAEILAGAQARLRRAEKATPNTDTTLASIVATILGSPKGLPGFPVYVASVPVDQPPRDAEKPLILAVQKKPHEKREDGSLTGEVSLEYHHNPQIHREIGKALIEDAGLAAGMNLSVTLAPSSEGLQRIGVRVLHAHTESPVIPSISPLTVHNFGYRVAQFASSIGQDGNVQWDRDKLYTGAYMSATLLNHEQVSESVENGRRTLVVSVDLGISEVGTNYTGISPHVLIEREFTEGFDGRFVPGLGVCEAVAIETLTNKYHQMTRRLTFTLASSV